MCMGDVPVPPYSQRLSPWETDRIYLGISKLYICILTLAFYYINPFSVSLKKKKKMSQGLTGTSWARGGLPKVQILYCLDGLLPCLQLPGSYEETRTKVTFRDVSPDP